MAYLFNAYHENELTQHWAPREIVLIYATYRHLNRMKAPG